MKAILVIDMPKDCGECMLLADGFLEKQNRWFDKCWVKQKLLDNDLKKPKWCPLKPMPEKKKTLDDIYAGSGFDRGWNACIDTILENNNETNI